MHSFRGQQTQGLIGMKIIDGYNAVLGRLASMTAKTLLKGEEVAIVNAEKIIITGDARSIKARYIERRRRGSPQHGPFFPKQPHMIVRRTIRGMLPYKTSKGRSAMKRLKVYTGVPESFRGEELTKMATKDVRSRYIRIGEIARTIGWKS